MLVMHIAIVTTMTMRLRLQMAFLVPLNNRGSSCDSRRSTHTLMVISTDAQENDPQINIWASHVSERPPLNAFLERTRVQVVHR
jgi:hypothetical protein